MIVADIFDKGGIIVWILAGYSLLALAIVFERLLRFILMGRPGRKAEQQLQAALRDGHVETLIPTIRGPEGRLLQGIYQAWQEGISDLNRVAIRIGSRELSKMEKGFRTLGFLGNTAPLLGLLGTIIGMIKAFMVIEQAGGQVDAQALAGGIWEAMLTTGVGLSVAIPILLVLHLLESASDNRAQNMRNFASLLLENLSKNQQDSCATETEAVHHRNGVVHAV